MKKALAILSALALVSVVAFAEDAPALKLSGYIDTGIKSVTGDGADTVQLWGDDSGSTTRFDLNGTYTNGNAGVDFKLRTQDMTAPAINYFHAWTNLFDGKAKLVAGKLDNSAWKTEGDDGFTSENDQGIQVQIIPVAGLNLGVKFNTNGNAAITPKQFLNETGFGAKYTSDLFNFAAGYKLDSDADDALAGKATYAYIDEDADGTPDIVAGAVGITTIPGAASDYANKEAYAYTGINYKGIAGLKLIAEAKWTGLGKYADIGLAEYDEIIEYKVSDPLSVGILMYQYIPGSSDIKSQLSFKPYVGYVVNSMVKATGEVKYVSNAAFVEKVNNVTFKPGVELTVSPSAKILINDAYTIADTGDEVAKTTTNTINVNFRWNF